LTEQNGKAYEIYHGRQLKLFTCMETIFLKPILEDDVKKYDQNLKGKLSANINEVPDVVVNKCIKFITKSWTHI
jgi:hypothetical protein